MAYSSWSVVYGEVPSAAKWNILGANDASFNDGTGIFGLYKNLLAVDSNPYKFRVSRNAAANSGAGAFAVIAFDTEQWDTNNNVSSGVYTVPVTGFYNFSWGSGATTSGAELFVCSLFVNGTEHTRGGGNTGTTVLIRSTGTALVSLTAGDTVDVRAFCSNARALEVSTTYLTYFSGFLVSRT